MSERLIDAVCPHCGRQGTTVRVVLREDGYTKLSRRCTACGGEFIHTFDHDWLAVAKNKKLQADNERLTSDVALVAERVRQLLDERDYALAEVDRLRAENAHLCAEIERLRAELDKAQHHIEMLKEKIDAEKSCACAYDDPNEVCLPHSPLLEKARAENEQLRDQIYESIPKWQANEMQREINRLREALKVKP